MTTFPLDLTLGNVIVRSKYVKFGQIFEKIKHMQLLSSVVTKKSYNLVYFGVSQI